MFSERDKEGNSEMDIWVISVGRPLSLDLSNICNEPVSGPVTEFRISEFTRYLLNPNPITLEEKVVGCNVEYSTSSTGPVRRLWRKMFHNGKDSPDSGDTVSESEEIISPSGIGPPSFKDEGLNAHFRSIITQLRPYDPLQKRLAELDRDKIEEVKAVCEDLAGNRYKLNLQGSINDKIGFVSNSIYKTTKVIANKAYLLNGLFEMRGYNFQSYNPEDSYRLIKFIQNDQPRYCVLNASYQFEYWIKDNLLVNYMHILEQSIQSDQKLREAMTLCIKGKAKSLKLFFAKQLGQDYSDKHIPMVYREVFNSSNINQNEKEALASTLNKNQNIISFNFVPITGPGKNKLCTNISVLHDFRALEPIKTQLPEVYSEIDKKAQVSDAGKLYLLDSMRGYQNV